MKIPSKIYLNKRNMPVYLSIFGMVFVLVGLPLRYYSLVSIGTMSIVISAGWCFFNLCTKNYGRGIIFPVVILLVITFMSFFSSFPIKLRSIVHLISFLELPILTAYCGKQQTKSVRKTVYCIFWMLSLFWIILSFTNKAYVFRTEYGDGTISELTLSYQNPNQISMYLMATLFILTSGVYFFKSTIVRNVFRLPALVVFTLIIKTGSRTCIILAIIFLLYDILCNRIKNNLNVIPILLFPAIFAIFILFFGKIYENIKIMGDAFDTGRIYIYQSVFRDYSLSKFLFGDFSKYQFSNLHNGYVSILASTGILVLGYFIWFIYTLLREIQKINVYKYQKLAFAGLLLIIVHSSTESAMLVTGSAYAVIFMALSIVSTQIKE